MSLHLIQYHCGRLLDSLVTNPQVKYHVRRISQIAVDDLNLLTRRTVERTSVWWRRTKNNMRF